MDVSAKLFLIKLSIIDTKRFTTHVIQCKIRQRLSSLHPNSHIEQISTDTESRNTLHKVAYEPEIKIQPIKTISYTIHIKIEITNVQAVNLNVSVREH